MGHGWDAHTDAADVCSGGTLDVWRNPGDPGQ
jgi:hypothetical protein